MLSCCEVRSAQPLWTPSRASMYLLVPALIGHGDPHRMNRGLWRLVAVGLGAARQQKQSIWIESLACTGKWMDLRFGLGEALNSPPMMGDGAGHGHGRGVEADPSGISQPFIHHPIKRHTHTHTHRCNAHTPNTTTHVLNLGSAEPRRRNETTLSSAVIRFQSKADDHTPYRSSN